MSILKEEQREVANIPMTRNRNARSTVSQVHQQPEPEQTHKQEDASVRERLKSCVPSDTKTLLFALVAIVYLIVGVIHFFGWTGDTSMLTNLLEVVGGYKGLTEITSLFSRGKKGGHDLQSSTGE
jgi:hypothetical protein